MAKYLDKETQSIAATVSDVLEGKAPKKEEKKNKKKAVKEVEQPKAPDGKNGPQTGEVDFKKKHKVKKVGVKTDLDGTVYNKEEKKADDKEVEELTDKQKKYQEFFQKALKRFKVDSPAELDKEGRKKFFDYVDKNYDAGDNESD